MRVHREHGRNRRAPLLSAGELIGRARSKMLNMEMLQGLRDLLPDALFGIAAVLQPECDIFANGRHKQLVVGILKHQPDHVTNQREILLAERNPVDDCRSRCWQQEPAQHREQCRLARAVAADKTDAVLRLDGKRNVVQRAQSIRVDIG